MKITRLTFPTTGQLLERSQSFGRRKPSQSYNPNDFSSPSRPAGSVSMSASDISAIPAIYPFHHDFCEYHLGDVILQAGDRSATCFYFRKDLLSSLSSFFNTLPPPATCDLRNGIALIPLHDATSHGLHIYLCAILSTTLSEPNWWDIPSLVKSDFLPSSLLDAAVIGRIYDTPIIFRLLAQYCSLLRRFADSEDDPYLTYGIWAIGDIRSQLPAVAKRTISSTSYDIINVDDYTVEIIRAHVPRHWLQLQEYHLRVLQAPKNFHKMLLKDEEALAGPFKYHSHSRTGACSESSPEDAWVVFRAAVKQALTYHQIMGLEEDRFGGLSCSVCLTEARQRISGAMKWLEGFVSFSVKT